jgi:SAM-dependent methyltransferase
MRWSFVESVLNTLIADGLLSPSDSLLAVCAGAAEQEVFLRLGLTNAVISNLDLAAPGGPLDASALSTDGVINDSSSPFGWSRQDATNLTIEDASFDFAFVADGLHHTSAPHRAVLEMYRVARRGIIVIESRYSLIMRVANWLRLSPEYEVESVIACDCRAGGLNDTEIPNYIYRWTEAEFTKTIRSFNPLGKHTFRFFYELNLPYSHAEMKKSKLKLRIVQLTEPVLRALTRIFRKQCNSFAMVALKPSIPEELWPWLTGNEGQVHFNRDYAEAHFKLRPTS